MASAIYPPTSSAARVVTGLKKQMLEDDGTLVPGLKPLTSDPLRDYETPEEALLQVIFFDEPGETRPPMTDWAMLNRAWLELPDFATPLPEEEWAQYADAFAGHSAGWLLVPEWESESDAMMRLRLRFQTAQQSELSKAIERGEIVLRAPKTLQPDAGDSNEQRSVRFVLIEEFKAYAAKFEIAVVVAADRAVSNVPRPISPIRTKPTVPHKFDTDVKGPVNWKHWRTVTTELWQALLLSLNVEPPGSGWLLNNASSGPDRTGDIPYAHLDKLGLTDEFARRCRVLTGWLQKQHAKAGRAAEVELTEFIELPFFAALAVDFGWASLPAEMVLLANEWKATTKATVNTPPAMLGGSSLDSASCPDRVSLHWLFAKFDEHAGLVAFPEEAIAVLRRTARGDERRNTNSPATSARALVERWVASRKLAIYDRRGDALLAPLTGSPVTEDMASYQALSDNLDDEMDIDRDDLVSLMTSEGMTVPSFLRHTQAAPASTAADTLRAQWWASVHADEGAPRDPDYDAKYARAAKLYDDLEKWQRMKHNDDPLREMEIERRLSSIRAELAEINRIPESEAVAPKGVEPFKVEGISKTQALEAFAELVNINLKSALEDVPNWIADARLSKGTAGGRHKTVWCPILLAVCLNEQHRVKKARLNQAFFSNEFLKNWRERWHEQSDDLVW